MIKEQKRDNDAQSITAIQWNPMNNGEAAYMDDTGQFGVITDIFDSDNNILDRDGNLEEEMNGEVNFDDRKLLF